MALLVTLARSDATVDVTLEVALGAIVATAVTDAPIEFPYFSHKPLYPPTLTKPGIKTNGQHVTIIIQCKVQGIYKSEWNIV